VDRLIVAAVLVVVAVVAAIVLQRRRPDAPTGGDWSVPAQLDRDDFDRPSAPWLVAVFTSATCSSCQSVWERAQPLESDHVAVQHAEVAERADLHRRYGIDAVPTLVVADADGVVRASFVGPVNATDLWGTLAELREPGSVPPSCDHGAAAGTDDPSAATT
jgi:hypothetical protein